MDWFFTAGMVLLLLWLAWGTVFGLIGVVIARRRGGSTWVAMALGYVLLPLAPIVVLVSTRQKGAGAISRARDRLRLRHAPRQGAGEPRTTRRPSERDVQLPEPPVF